MIHGSRKTVVSVSIARWLAWAEAWGRPPTVRTSSSLLTRRASSTVLPLASSVMAEPQAMAGTQPLARKRISTMRLPSSFKVSSKMSPQTGFSRRAARSGDLTSPAFRGFWKWSSSSAEYTWRLYVPAHDIGAGVPRFVNGEGQQGLPTKDSSLRIRGWLTLTIRDVLCACNRAPP
jgi:hypothetical protein